MPPVAATGTTGFFQVQPEIPNRFDEDAALNRAARLFLSPELVTQLSPDLSRFAGDISTPQHWSLVANAEYDLPYLAGSGFKSFGSPNPDPLVTSNGWKQLQAMGIREGIVANGYEHNLKAYARVHQMLKLYLWGPASSIVTCPSAMQDGATSVLLRELLRKKSAGQADAQDALRTKVFESALVRLLSRDPNYAWTSGQWMTERPGGSDVAGTETVGTHVGMGGPGVDANGHPLGPWRVDGFKWFSSATDSGCAVLLAKTDDTGRLSCFFAPTRYYVNGVEHMNGIRIQRLKNKLGTKSLPTAEIELKGMRAWLIGEEGRGVAHIATVLNITRLYNAVAASADVGRGLAVARAFARVRKFPSRKPPHDTLRSLPLFVKTIAGVTLAQRADTLFTMFVAALVGAGDHPGSPTAPILPKDPKQVAALIRVLTPVLKASTAKHAIVGMQECMESLGGVGYMENVETPEINLACLFRNANVLPIWEGTTDVLSTDTIKVLHGRSGPEVVAALDAWLHSSLPKGQAREAQEILTAWSRVTQLAQRQRKAEAIARAREVLFAIADIVSATLLLADAAQDGNALALAIAQRFVRRSPTFPGLQPEEDDWEKECKLDSAIAFEGEANLKPKGKL